MDNSVTFVKPDSKPEKDWAAAGVNADTRATLKLLPQPVVWLQTLSTIVWLINHAAAPV